MKPWIAWIVPGDLGSNAASSSSAYDPVKLSDFNRIENSLSRNPIDRKSLIPRCHCFFSGPVLDAQWKVFPHFPGLPQGHEE